MVECTIKGESCGYRCTGYNGSKIWKKIHDLPKEIECEECSSHADSNFKGLHDAVNLGLGKKPYDADNFSKFAKEVQCSYNRCKEMGLCQ